MLCACCGRQSSPPSVAACTTACRSLPTPTPVQRSSSARSRTTGHRVVRPVSVSTSAVELSPRFSRSTTRPVSPSDERSTRPATQPRTRAVARRYRRLTMIQTATDAPSAAVAVLLSVSASVPRQTSANVAQPTDAALPPGPARRSDAAPAGRLDGNDRGQQRRERNRTSQLIGLERGQSKPALAHVEVACPHGDRRKQGMAADCARGNQGSPVPPERPHDRCRRNRSQRHAGQRQHSVQPAEIGRSDADTSPGEPTDQRQRARGRSFEEERGLVAKAKVRLRRSPPER